jgi:arylsulfatase
MYLFLFVLVCALISGCQRNEIRLLDLMPRAKKEVSEGQFPNFREGREWIEDIRLEGEARRALTPPFPAQIRFPVEVPEHSVLETSVAVVTPRVVKRGRVAFIIEAELAGRTVELHRSEVRSPQANRWHDVSTDLTAFSGKAINLTLKTRPVLDQEQIPWANRILTAWGEPTLSTRPTRPLGASEPPSFVFMLVDTLRVDYLGPYGFEGKISPAIDRLAMESLVFEKCFSNSPWTKPAIATLFTSLYPDVHGVTDIGKPSWRGTADEAEVLSSKALTLAELLQDNGYRTAAFIANPWISPRHGFSQGFQQFEQHERTEELLEAAGEWLEGSSDHPFFLYLHFMDVHGPYNTPRKDFEALVGSSSLGERRVLSEEDYSGIPSYLKKTAWASDADRLSLTAWRAKYAAGVRAFDRRVRPFLDALRDSGTLDRTYLFLTSDHGEELMDHGRWDHGYNLLEHQLHVPLLIRKPLAEDAGRKVTALVSLIDLAPTILSLAKIQLPDVQGADLSGLLRKFQSPRSAAVFSAGVKKEPGLHAARTERHKIIWDIETDELRVYDLLADPQERDDIARANPDLVGQLHRPLLRHLVEIQAREALPVENVPISKQMSERLRALGYIQ